MLRRNNPPAEQLTGEDMIAQAVMRARYFRNPGGEISGDQALQALDKLLLYVGRTLIVKSLDDSRSIEKSRFVPVGGDEDELPRYAYVRDSTDPMVAEAQGKLEIPSPFSSDIRLKGRERQLFIPKQVYFHLELLDSNLEPTVSVEVLDPQ